MQNLPRDPAYRQCFRPGTGRVLVKADYSQIELRIAAKVANETRMIKAYRQGGDLHTLTAQQMTGRTEVTKQERQLAKPVNFGVPGGLGAASLVAYARNTYKVEMTLEQARAFRTKLITEIYPELSLYLAEDGMALLASNRGPQREAGDAGQARERRSGLGAAYDRLDRRNPWDSVTQHSS